MSIDRIRLINRCLGIGLIVAYLALGYFVLADLLPTSAVAILTANSAKR
jgi:hypothetical protein